MTLDNLCKNTESTWQTKEGAVLGINAVLRNFQWVGSIPQSSGASSLSFDLFMHTEYLLRVSINRACSINDVDKATNFLSFEQVIK